MATSLDAGAVFQNLPGYGSSAWLRPLTVLGPRLFKFGAEIDF